MAEFINKTYVNLFAISLRFINNLSNNSFRNTLYTFRFVYLRSINLCVPNFYAMLGGKIIAAISRNPGFSVFGK